MSTGKRLFRYALNYKRIISIALVMLTIAVVSDLAGPFIAKKLIDEHILGIESVWYKTEPGSDAVEYEGRYYTKEKTVEDDSSVSDSVRIFQVGRNFVFVEDQIEFDGNRSYNDGILTINKGSTAAQYEAELLSGDELMEFYKPEIPKIIKLLAIYFGLLVVASIFQYGQKFYLQKSANRIIQKLREDVFRQIQRLPIQYFDNLPAGKVVARITNDTEAIRELYVTVLSTFFTSIIYITGIYIALFILNAKLAAICLLLLPILFIWAKLYRKYASKYNHVIRSRVSDINGMINESIQGMSIIQAFSREKETQQEFETLNKEHFTYQNKLLNLNSSTSHNLVQVLRNIVYVAFLWYFGSEA